MKSVTQTANDSLTITAYVERSNANSAFAHMTYEISAEDGRLLDFVPSQGDDPDEKGTPPVGQRRKLILVVADTKPRTTHLTITLRDMQWIGGQDLVLKGVPAPSKN
ncbi:hypothetical protein [Streptomyces adustus]